MCFALRRCCASGALTSSLLRSLGLRGARCSNRAGDGIEVSLLPFFIADILFPYIVGAGTAWMAFGCQGVDTDFKIYFSTCFWPTTTCLFFIPSMVAAIRFNWGDSQWAELRSQGSGVSALVSGDLELRLHQSVRHGLLAGPATILDL